MTLATLDYGSRVVACPVDIASLVLVPYGALNRRRGVTWNFMFSRGLHKNGKKAVSIQSSIKRKDAPYKNVRHIQKSRLIKKMSGSCIIP
jgi:hypothetical protein